MTYSTDFLTLLQEVQEHISERYSASLTDPEKREQLLSYIEKYLYDLGYDDEETSVADTAARLYREMAEYSLLTPYLSRGDVEEINVNRWDDIAVTYTDGRVEKLEQQFLSPQHAVDIVKRLLHHSGMIIDNAMPLSQGHLPGNTRITALKTPLVDAECGISASIRLLHPSTVTREQLIKSEGATREMIDFLCLCLRHGISFVIAGATSSGKTTLLNALLESVPNERRIFTIESGSRELELLRKKDGRVVNNVVHTLSRPSEKASCNITQEDLVIASLRFNPDIVAVGEMRDVEANSAVEASLTGHTVVSTIHSFAGSAAHMRLALLCQKRFPIDFQTSLIQAGQAFPIVVYERKLDDNSRRIMDISECVITASGSLEYHTLFRYHILANIEDNDTVSVHGRFEQPERISDSLRERFLQGGASQKALKPFSREEAFK